MENATFGERVGMVVSDFCKKEGVSLRHVALHRLGLKHEQNLRSTIIRKSTHAPHDLVVKVVELTGCRLEWLVSGQGEPYGSGPVAGARVAEKAARYGVTMPEAVQVFHVTDGSMDQGEYRPAVVLAHPKETAASGDLALVEFAGGRRAFRRVFYDAETVTSVALSGSAAPEITPRARVAKIMKVWAVVLGRERE